MANGLEQRNDFENVQQSTGTRLREDIKKISKMYDKVPDEETPIVMAKLREINNSITEVNSETRAMLEDLMVDLSMGRNLDLNISNEEKKEIVNKLESGNYTGKEIIEDNEKMFNYFFDNLLAGNLSSKIISNFKNIYYSYNKSYGVDLNDYFNNGYVLHSENKNGVRVLGLKEKNNNNFMPVTFGNSLESKNRLVDAGILDIDSDHGITKSGKAELQDVLVPNLFNKLLNQYPNLIKKGDKANIIVVNDKTWRSEKHFQYKNSKISSIDRATNVRDYYGDMNEKEFENFVDSLNQNSK